jgi:hypothetical protein
VIVPLICFVFISYCHIVQYRFSAVLPFLRIR